jgi:pimeloyl-ACP methyl ester carboxylesterase
MTNTTRKTMRSVPVEGGVLHAAVWAGPPDAPAMLALHGITGNHAQFAYLADELASDYCVVAPDLRGRGASASIAGPFDMDTHARDAVALLDALEIDRAVVVGHSMGCYVATRLGWHAPERVERLVLVDGGIGTAPPPDFDIDAILQAVIGPAIERLSMTFPSVDEYRANWREHPALSADWTDVVQAAIDYEIAGEPPVLHSSVSREAVRLDAIDTLHPDTLLAIERTTCAIDLLVAERGMLDQETPVFVDAVVDNFRERLGSRMQVRRVTGVNHYTIALSERGAKEIATAVRG